MNQTPIDKWTLVHALTGAAAGAFGVSPALAIGGAIVYEFLEQYMERTGTGHKIFKTSGPESLTNAVVDVAVYTGTYALMKRV